MQAALVVFDEDTGSDVWQYSTLHAFTRVNPLFVVYHFRPPDGRGPGGNRPCPQQPQLNPTPTTEDHHCCGSAHQPWTGKQGDVDLELAERGRKLHNAYCEKCHKQNGHFQDKETPPLAGQARGYLLFQMSDYRVAATLMPQPPLMQERLEKLSDADLVALSEFYASHLTRLASTLDASQ